VHHAARLGAESIDTFTPVELADLTKRDDVAGYAMAELEQEFIQPLRDHLQRCITGVEEGEEASSQLRAVYREWKVQRIEAVVEHVLLAAHGRGAFAAVKQGVPICWMVDTCKGPCAEGDDNVLGGAVPAGEVFPTGHYAAPAYRGCRCAVVPAAG
jgi:hypothetical protein